MEARICCLLIALAAGGCGDEVFVAMETLEHIEGTSPITLEASCGSAFEDDSASSFGFGIAPADSAFVDELSVERLIVGEELQVRVRNAGVTLAAKGYGRGFLESGKLDSFTVMTRGGHRYEFLHQGGPDCESIELFSQ